MGSLEFGNFPGNQRVHELMHEAQQIPSTTYANIDDSLEMLERAARIQRSQQRIHEQQLRQQAIDEMPDWIDEKRDQLRAFGGQVVSFFRKNSNG